MRTVSLSEAKAKLSSLLDSVEGHDEEVVITRHGRAAAVLVSPDDLESWKETATVRANTDLVAEIAPVRNEIAHVREVERDRLLRASVACADVLEMLQGKK